MEMPKVNNNKKLLRFGYALISRKIFQKNVNSYCNFTKFLDLMEESPEEVLKRQEMVKLYDACDEAIRIIRDYMTRQPTQSGRSMTTGPQLPVRPIPTPTSGGGSTSGPPPPFRPGRGVPQQGVASRSAPSVPPRPTSIHN